MSERREPRHESKEPGPISSLGEHVARGQEVYLGQVAHRLRNRCGMCPQAKGVAQEIMFGDRLNARPRAVVLRLRARQPNSRSTRTADLVLTREGRRGTFGLIQVKDVTSTGGIGKTLRQVRAGQYRRSSLFGSPETVKEYSRAGGQSVQRMHSTGISSTTTTRVAAQAGCKVRGINAGQMIAADIAKTTASAAALSGGTQLLLGVASGFQAIQEGTPVDQVVRQVAGQTASAFGASGVKTATAVTIRHGLTLAAERLTAEVVRDALKSGGATGVVFSVVELAYDALSLATGSIDKEEFRERSCSTAGGTGGALTGAAVGSALLPGLGTILGAVVGGAAGQVAGMLVARPLGVRAVEAAKALAPDRSTRWKCRHCQRTIRQNGRPDPDAWGTCGGRASAPHEWLSKV